jgi:beta-galactosidase
MIIKNSGFIIFFISFCLLIVLISHEIFADSSPKGRQTELFTKNWQFFLGDIPNGQEPDLNDSEWRKLNLPHDWSIEGEFNEDNPATTGGGALPGGIGWYRKSFTLPEADKEKLIFIDFDGVYRNSEVWINGHYLGKRPYGYSSFRYELTPFLKYGNEKNLLAVKVDNSEQPNSRWYSGSGIYRNVWLVKTGKIYIDHWGTFITTPEVSESAAKVNIETKIQNTYNENKTVSIVTVIIDSDGNKVDEKTTNYTLPQKANNVINQDISVVNPSLWSVENPNLYKAVTTIQIDNQAIDEYETIFGIRTFYFDIDKGFFLNGKKVKIKGVCNHHDLGCLGAAVNCRAIERQLAILKEMGANGIRTAHNPPAPELLDLCDEMGFIVMDEAFDMWKKGKNKYDYSLDWDEWHQRDLQDMVLRDRNHPSVFTWSIGNEVMEQWDKNDSSGQIITKELVSVVKKLDPTRPVTANCNDRSPLNPLVQSGALDLIGLSYGHNEYTAFPDSFPGQKFIASETTSALATRGSYDMPSDSIRRWPIRWDLPFNEGNPDNTCSSYDNCSAPWGSTHEETWKIIKKYDFISGMYIWTGFDYLGEPTPYSWPSRSSYFGIIDLAGFPKDAYYLYQSEWTNKPVLHIFPHWNPTKRGTTDKSGQAGRNEGDTIDVWAYTNYDEVELFLNDKSLGKKRKTGDDLHLMWRVSFTPGILKAVGNSKDKGILMKEIKTAGPPSKIILEADKSTINADGTDLSFITVKILDDNDILVPNADNLISFEITGEGKIIGVDNGLQTSLESFKANYRRAFNGMCLAVIQSNEKQGQIKLTAISKRLKGASIIIESK